MTSTEMNVLGDQPPLPPGGGPRTWLRRLRRARRTQRTISFVMSTISLLHLIASLPTRRLTEVWVGDSNAMCFNVPLTVVTLIHGPEGQFVWHRGPKLMFSIARDGYPRKVWLLARLVRVLGRRGTVVLVSSAGEIDVRCHLVDRSARPDFNLDFVGGYLEQLGRLGEGMRARYVVHSMHVPPSPWTPELPGFPIRGTLDERYAMSRRMRDEVTARVAAYDGPADLRLFDTTPAITDDEGHWLRVMTADGVHPSELGRTVVRCCFHDLGLVPDRRRSRA